MGSLYTLIERVGRTAAGALIIGAAAVTLVPSTAFAHCKGKHADTQPAGHEQCPGGGDTGTPDRIAGSAVFDAGPITGDGLGAYTDGVIVDGWRGGDVELQAALNCKANHFNITPGGLERRIEFDIGPGLLPTGIDSCKDEFGNSVPVTFVSTAGMDSVSCANTPDDPEWGGDWGFDQVFRSSAPSGAPNLCDLKVEDAPLEVSLRFQTNLHHRSGCRGGKGKCGTTFEGIEVNYGDTGYCSPSDPVLIRCSQENDGECQEWRVEKYGLGRGCLSYDMGAGAESQLLPFGITFTPTP